MTDDKWKDTLDRIAEKFEVLERGEAPLPEYPNGRCEFIVFSSPVGKVRLERISKPRTVGQRSVTSRRIGGTARVESVYDLHDFVHFIRAQRWDAASGGWQEMETPKL